MKALITILVVAAAIFGGWKLLDYWGELANEREARQQPSTSSIDPSTLQGLPPQMEAPLKEAYRKGAAGLKEWLEKYRRSPQVKDPRLAWIELDYVVLITHDNPAEAKRVFAGVKQRVSPQSPVYQRVKALEKTYE